MLVPVDPPRRAVDVADDTFLVAEPAVVAELVRDPASWALWWPDLTPTVTRDRGVKGVQWAVVGALVGSMEIWLEPWGDGVVLHWYLRADPARPGRRTTRSGVDARVRAWKGQVHALKDRLEAGRVPGAPRAGPPVKKRVEPAESP